MKFLLLYVFFLSFGVACSQEVTELPAGKYQTNLKNSQLNWEHGDIIILDAKHYKLSTGSDTGEYKFSIAAQRIFFTSGPLQSAYAQMAMLKSKPAIVLPVKENASLGLKAEVWAIQQ